MRDPFFRGMFALGLLDHLRLVCTLTPACVGTSNYRSMGWALKGLDIGICFCRPAPTVAIHILKGFHMLPRYELGVVQMQIVYVNYRPVQV